MKCKRVAQGIAFLCIQASQQVSAADAQAASSFSLGDYFNKFKEGVFKGAELSKQALLLKTALNVVEIIFYITATIVLWQLFRWLSLVIKQHNK